MFSLEVFDSRAARRLLCLAMMEAKLSVRLPSGFVAGGGFNSDEEVILSLKIALGVLAPGW